ncbi:MAG: methyltransferase domain-containing protein [Xanthomonadales bacterium]|nr:class I SAM-dependent methyltransferase [Xanthomonadales bacterium]NIX13295.1 methyltransferase domain-containing protein [Xanthomonadales bacterium]
MEAGKDISKDAGHRSRGPIGWAELGLVPDSVIRAGIRRLNLRRLEDVGAADNETAASRLNDFVRMMKASPIALVPELANEQHYEVPAEFFGEVMGEHRKYSCCHWTGSTRSLDEAEEEALRITCRRAGIEDGMQVLDLGCGWGSLSLWIAQQYPGCKVLSVSNSSSQREYVVTRARERGLENIEVVTADMNDFDTERRFDRVVSIEMFEHMRNYPELFRRIAGWLNPGGRFFMHIFCHRNSAYEFVDKGPADWMSRHFFSGGIMPSDDLPLRFQRDLEIRRQWRWNGRHYRKTADAWLANMDRNRARILPILAETYGETQAEMWFQRWRIFFMACAELFGHDRGQEWYVSHYLFEKPAKQNTAGRDGGNSQ